MSKLMFSSVNLATSEYEPYAIFRCSVGCVMTNGARQYYQSWRQYNQWHNRRVGNVYELLEEAIRELMLFWLEEMGF